MTSPREIAEATARNSYGRLIAYLGRRTRDLAAAEDALAEAFLNALQTWPIKGVPENPEAWLLSIARRKAVDAHRKDRFPSGDGSIDLPGPTPAFDDAPAIPDERLELMFACAHPAIDPGVRTPLILQTVLGVDAGRIASAFLVAPSTMSQRLVRAKSKIRDSGIAFAVPDRDHLPERLESVLDAVYVVFGTSWDDVAGGESSRPDMTEEALCLGRLIVQLLPNEPEAAGLLALMLYCDSRRRARYGSRGEYIPLDRQDCRLWDHGRIAEAEGLLGKAVTFGRMGRFQLEAAIQSAHAQRALGFPTNWIGITRLYDALVQLASSIGAMVGRAAAHAEAFGAEAGLQLLKQLPEERIRDYQPYWALRGHLLRRLGFLQESQIAIQRAAGLSQSASIRQFLLLESAASAQ